MKESTTIQQRPSPAMAIARRSTPDELVEWLRQEHKNGALRFELHERSLASGMALPIDSYTIERATDAQDVADTIFRRASAEHAAFPLVGTNAYQVRSYKDERPRASMTFRVMAEAGGSSHGGEGPHALDVIRQTQRHLEERELAQQTLTLEAISAIHVSRADTTAQFKEILDASMRGSKHSYDQLDQTMATMRDENVRLRADNARLFERALEMSVLHEELVSKKHERDLESEKYKRDADRKDKAFQSIVVERLIPAFAMKFGVLGGKVNGTAGDVAAPAPKATPVVLTAAQIHAISAFLAHANEHPDDLLKMRAAISEPAQELLDELVMSFGPDAGATATANGAAANANGAPS